MKKINTLKSLLLLITVLTFSMCEDSEKIQFVVKDSFDNIEPIEVKGLKGQTSYTLSTTADISELLDNASSFVKAEVESIAISLVDYSGNSIEGNIKISSGSLTFLDQNVSISETPSALTIPSGVINILSILKTGVFPVTIEGVVNPAIADNDFELRLTFVVKAVVE
ncbi:MAG: hypothetical protein ABF263_04770 [Polaribacter sp.]